MNTNKSIKSPLDKRRAGILLHPTSLPADFSNGDIGPAAYRFVDFIAHCGFSVWQMLPLGPTHGINGSPYQTLSTHAGNTDLISPILMAERGWINLDDFTVEQKESPNFRTICTYSAWKNLIALPEHSDLQLFQQCCQSHKNWLDDYALFIAIREDQMLNGWTQWPEGLRNREPDALAEVSERLHEKIECIKFGQFSFFIQWQNLKQYANEKGILLFGDLPIFVAHDSADVWAERDNFHLNELGQCSVVAGVPPDYFSETGQRWGNPIYDWKHMLEDNFSWWKKRIQSQIDLYDLIRIDHFRGLQAYWEIPAESETAINGQWIEAPGEELLDQLYDSFDNLALVAEDLGIITPEVEDLRDKFQLPGMKILQFAFSHEADNPYLPHNHSENSVVYTGTHDNDTTLAWATTLNDNDCGYIQNYFKADCSVENLLKWATLSSVAKLAIIPMQDFLNLGIGHRMNTPGTIEGNWNWGFNWEQITEANCQDARQLITMYGRL